MDDDLVFKLVGWPLVTNHSTAVVTYLEVSCDHSGTERCIGQVLRFKSCPLLPKWSQSQIISESSLFHRPFNPNLFGVDSIPDFLLYQEKGKSSQSCSVKRSLFYLVEEKNLPIHPMKLAIVKMSARFHGTVMYASKPSFHSCFISAQASPCI